MALIKCSECQKEISDKAVSCPYCGCPTGRPINTSVQLDSAPHKRRKYRIQSLIFTPMFIFGLIFGFVCIFWHWTYWFYWHNYKQYWSLFK